MNKKVAYLILFLSLLFDSYVFGVRLFDVAVLGLCFFRPKDLVHAVIDVILRHKKLRIVCLVLFTEAVCEWMAGMIGLEVLGKVILFRCMFLAIGLMLTRELRQNTKESETVVVGYFASILILTVAQRVCFYVSGLPLRLGYLLMVPSVRDSASYYYRPTAVYAEPYSVVLGCLLCYLVYICIVSEKRKEWLILSMIMLIAANTQSMFGAVVLCTAGIRGMFLTVTDSVVRQKSVIMIMSLALGLMSLIPYFMLRMESESVQLFGNQLNQSVVRLDQYNNKLGEELGTNEQKSKGESINDRVLRLFSEECWLEEGRVRTGLEIRSKDISRKGADCGYNQIGSFVSKGGLVGLLAISSIVYLSTGSLWVTSVVLVLSILVIPTDKMSAGLVLIAAACEARVSSDRRFTALQR